MKQLFIFAFAMLMSVGMQAQGGMGGGARGMGGGGGRGGMGGGMTIDRDAIRQMMNGAGGRGMSFNAAEMRTEQFQNQATKLAKTLKLKKDKKDMFVVIYLNWQTDRFNAINPVGGDVEQDEARLNFSNMTDSVANTAIASAVARQALLVEVDKQYFKQFKGILTPQQAAQVMLTDTSIEGNMRRNMRSMGGMMDFGGMDFGGGGFGGGGFGGGFGGF